MKARSMMWQLGLVIFCILQTAWAEVPSDAVWIDVRSPAEYASGHLQQATLIPFDGIEVGVAQLQLSKDTPIYLYCGSGGRAGVAKNRLDALDYTNVTNVGGLEVAQKLAVDSEP